jgi:disulfide bond formation protein DsbB
MISGRQFYLILFLTAASLLGYGYYLQFVDGLNPCPLCIFQRVAYIAIIIIGFIGLLHGPRKVWSIVYSSLILLSALIGAGIAGRQVWLQHLPPDRVPECGPGLDFMLDVFPLAETLRMVFTGSGECAEVDWTFLGFSIAEWSLAWFILFAIAAAVHLFRRVV